MAKETQLTDLLRPVVESMGFVFWGIEFIAQGRQSMLRVFIDHANGINVDDCAAVSRQLSAVLDVEDPITQEYTLEVSSPGMDRPLFSIEQYQQYANHIIELRLRMPFEGRRKFKGQLIGVEQEDIVLVVDEHEYLLPVELIEKAHVVPQFKD
ncbi:ribosome maturation factor RimP [Oceanospirillaceae bacterium ASx5O]|nr:ribosome maturation factor RimP [Oceanospirillaceae bacterium ASx5O]